jgi:hypothetical protein
VTLYTGALSAPKRGDSPYQVIVGPSNRRTQSATFFNTNDKHHACSLYSRPYFCTTLLVKAPA